MKKRTTGQARAIMLCITLFISASILAACGPSSDSSAPTGATAVDSSLPTIGEHQGLGAADDALKTSEDSSAYAQEEREFVYAAPQELGDDLSSFNLVLDGDLYRMPAPLTVYIDNGWEITKEGLDDISVYENGFLSVEMTRNGKTFYGVQLGAINDGVVNIENFFVSGIRNITSPEYMFFGTNNQEITVVLPGGVTIGTPEDAMKEAYKSLFDSGDIYVRQDDDDQILYEYIGWYGRNIQLYVNKETKQVYNISMQNNTISQ